MDKPTMSKSTFMLASSLLSPKIRRATNHCYACKMAVHTMPPYASPLQEERTDDRSAQPTSPFLTSGVVTQEDWTCTWSRTLQHLYPTHHHIWHTSTFCGASLPYKQGKRPGHMSNAYMWGTSQNCVWCTFAAWAYWWTCFFDGSILGNRLWIDDSPSA